MKTIAFLGGSSIRELGPAADVELFFECISAFVVPRFPQENWSIVTDRLYRRYIRAEDLDAAAELMDRIHVVFEQSSSTLIDLGGATAKSAVTRLNLNGATLAEIFSRYFKNFAHVTKSAKLFLETFGKYKPIRIVISDMPEYLIDRRRPLESYDALDRQPFWLQHIPG